jgi:hypothetical protein
MASETLMKCAHPPCECLVEEEQKFCSSSCLSARTTGSGLCPCGHPGCLSVEQELTEEDDEADFLSAP